ncbi:MAG: NusA-like transcription termination signal-binding factor [Candidatus Altiarchaeota archaeon]
MKIRLGTEDIKYMRLFESLTGATVKDFVKEEGAVGFLIKKGDMGLAIGKGGANVEKMRNLVGKSIWIVEFDTDERNFVRNLFQPVKIKDVRFNNTKNEKTAIVEVSNSDKRKVIGHNGSRIHIARQLAKRHFMINNISIQST